MLPEERLEAILKIISERSGITNQELAQLTDSSISTIRRDVTELAERGLITKVHGGAMPAADSAAVNDIRMSERRIKNADAKKKIAAYAATLINAGDVIYIDAGTTTEFLAEYTVVKDAVYVTNAISHAAKLAARGFTVHVVGGMIKPVTEAIIGGDTVAALRRFNFTAGFFGANGISRDTGITTPDINEAAVKRQAVESCSKRYILADSSKFGRAATVSFADTDDVIIITEKKPEACTGCTTEVVQ